MKLLEKPILRTLPIFYAQATATRMRRLNFGVMLGLFLISSAVEATRAPSVPMGILIFLFLAFCSIWMVAALAFAWDWLIWRLTRSTQN